MAHKATGSVPEPNSPISPRVKRDLVLIAADGSEYSEYAIDFYLDTIHKPENHVIFVHSTEYKSISAPGVAMGGGGFNFTETIKEEEHKAAFVIEKLQKKMKEHNIDGEVIHVHGEAGPGIITVCNDKHADYIVIGCRGKGTVRRTLTGSVTDYVTHHAKVPVIAARHKDHLNHGHIHYLPSHLKH